MSFELIELDERALVEQKVNAFTGGKTAAFALALEPLLAASQFGLARQCPDSFEIFLKPHDNLSIFNLPRALKEELRQVSARLILMTDARSAYDVLADYINCQAAGYNSIVGKTSSNQGESNEALAHPRDRLVAEDVQGSSTSMARTGALPPAARVARALVVFVATGALVGFAPVVPGTVGSLLGLLLVKFAICSIWRYSPTGFLMLFGAVFVAACVVVDSAERIFAKPDSSAIVLDEILGMIATMLGNPISWPWLIAGFTLFRLFDIIKPWPVSRFDRMRGGGGVMLDDLAAAFYANITLRVLWRIV